jgi:Protein of unknown function (DUF1559)/Domain of unknown function (DUF4190)
MIRFSCSCGQELQVPDDSAGKKARCPACQTVCTVPDASETRAVRADRPAPSDEENEDRPRRRQRDEEFEDRPRRRQRGEEEEFEDRLRRRQRDEEKSPASRPTSGKATFALVLGILSVIPCVVTPVFAVPALIVSILALGDVKKKRLGGKGMAITGIALSVVSLVVMLPFYAILFFAVGRIRDAAGRMQSSNNLKQMALAMANHASTYNDSFPTATIRSKDGKPLLSWRVAMLPFLEQGQLYNEFHLDEPWDSPHNSKLLPRMPKVYWMPSTGEITDGKTYYQVFVGPDTMFADPDHPANYKTSFAIKGTSQTVTIAEADNAVPWTKPEDIVFNPASPPTFRGHWNGAFQVALADGSVRLVSTSVSPKTIKWAVSLKDEGPPPADW